VVRPIRAAISITRPSPVTEWWHTEMLRGWDEGYETPSLGIAVHPDARGLGLARTFMGFLHAAASFQGAARPPQGLS